MRECYSLPTAKPDLYTAEYSKFTNGVRASSPVTIQNVVMYDVSGRLQSGKLGINRFVQISSSTLPIMPGLNDQLMIDGKTYQIINPVKRSSPGFVTFWESEVLEIKKSELTRNPSI